MIESAVDRVIKLVQTGIWEGRFKSGDKLPSEAELCSLAGVSRGPVREAMKVLSATGIVEIRRGDGTYLANDGSESMIDSMVLRFQKSSWSLADLAEFRGDIEHIIVTNIIDKATDEEIDGLAVKNSMLRQAVENNLSLDAQVAMDLEFHRAMSSITHNVLETILYDKILDFCFHDVGRMYNESTFLGIVSYELHEEIIAALRKRDKKAAIKAIDMAMDNHILTPDELSERYRRS